MSKNLLALLLRWNFGLFRQDDAHYLARPEGIIILAHSLGGEFNEAACKRKQSVVTAPLYIFARMILGAALADKDGAGLGPLAVIDLDAEPFAF